MKTGKALIEELRAIQAGTTVRTEATDYELMTMAHRWGQARIATRQQWLQHVSGGYGDPYAEFDQLDPAKVNMDELLFSMNLPQPMSPAEFHRYRASVKGGRTEDDDDDHNGGYGRYIPTYGRNTEEALKEKLFDVIDFARDFMDTLPEGMELEAERRVTNHAYGKSGASKTIMLHAMGLDENARRLSREGGEALVAALQQKFSGEESFDVEIETVRLADVDKTMGYVTSTITILVKPKEGAGAQESRQRRRRTEDEIPPFSPDGGVLPNEGGEADAGNEPSIVEVPENVAASMGACMDIVVDLMPDIEVMRNGIEAHLAGDLDSPTAQMAGQAFEQAQALHSTMKEMMASVGLTVDGPEGGQNKAEGRRRRTEAAAVDWRTMRTNAADLGDYAKEIKEVAQRQGGASEVQEHLQGAKQALQSIEECLGGTQESRTEASDTTAVARNNWNALSSQKRAEVLNDVGADEQDLEDLASKGYDDMMDAAKELYDPSLPKALKQALITGAESRQTKTLGSRFMEALRGR